MADESKDQPTVVLDIGHDVTRAGFSGDDAPRCACRTAVAVAKNDHSKFFYGDAAVTRAAICHFVSMFNGDGVVSLAGWKHMPAYLRFLFSDELRVDPKAVRVLVLDSSPGLVNKPKYTNLLLDMGVKGVLVEAAAVGAAFSHGKENALVVDVGFTSTRVTPVLSGAAYGTPGVTHVGGEMVTHKLSYLVYDKSERKSRAMMSVLDDLKQKTCVVRVAGKRYPAKDYEMPDGETRPVSGDARVEATELLFDPARVHHKGSRNKALVALIKETVAPLGDAWAPHMYLNVVLAGSTTVLPGYKERVLEDLKKAVPATVMKGHEVTVLHTVEAKYCMWVGGSIMASLSGTQARFSTKRA